MKNVKNVKSVSRLTGALLAKKGTAAPSQASLSMNQAVINRFPASEYEPSKDQTGDHNPLESAIDTVKELTSRRNGASPNDSSGDISQLNETPDQKTAVIDNKSRRKGKISTKKSNFVKSAQKTDTQKRIAMTLRMEEEDHLKLRIFSAHTRKSCQIILSEALDLYFMENEDKVPQQKIASQHR